VEGHHVAGAHPALCRDDRHDVDPRQHHVEELLVAEVLDDVGLGLGGRIVAADGSHVEVLRADADDEVTSRRRADALAEPCRQRDLDAIALEPGGLAGPLQGHREEVHRRAADEAGHELVVGPVVESGRADLCSLAWLMTAIRCPSSSPRPDRG